MRMLVLLGLVGLVGVSRCVAQERCDEATVRRLAPMPVAQIAAPDIYFNTRVGEPPAVGTRAMEALGRAHAAERTNQCPYVFRLVQVAVSADQSMAYDDGSAHIEYDETATGRHISYEMTYLRVWRVVDGRCRITSYGRPDK